MGRREDDEYDRWVTGNWEGDWSYPYGGYTAEDRHYQKYPNQGKMWDEYHRAEAEWYAKYGPEAFVEIESPDPALFRVPIETEGD